MLRRKMLRALRRFLRHAGLPTTAAMWLLIIGLLILCGMFSAYITSDEFMVKSAQAAARQYLYNTTGRDIPVVIHEGNFKDGFSFSIPYEKIESEGTMSRRGVFSGTFWPGAGRLDGITREDYSRYGDQGRRTVTIQPDGYVRIQVEK